MFHINKHKILFSIVDMERPFRLQSFGTNKTNHTFEMFLADDGCTDKFRKDFLFVYVY
jgi:hypothetical protein